MTGRAERPDSWSPPGPKPPGLDSQGCPGRPRSAELACDHVAWQRIGWREPASGGPR